MSQHTIIEIVSVTYRRVRAGQRDSAYSDDFAISVPSQEEWPEDLPLFNAYDEPIPSWPRKQGDPGWGDTLRIDYPEDWFGLNFGFIGEKCERQIFVLEYETESIGASEIFGDWKDDLRVIGDALLEAQIMRERKRLLEARNPFAHLEPGKHELPPLPDDETPRQVTFLTAWKVKIIGPDRWADDYDQDMHMELLGRLDPSRIESIIIPLALPVA